MKFQFEGLTDFLYMSGHGPYVWACYGLTAACLIYLCVSPVLKRRKLMTELKRQARITEHELRQQAARGL